MDDAKNPSLFHLNAIDDDVFTDGKGAPAVAQVVIALAARIWMGRKEMKPVDDRFNQGVSDADAAALRGNINPNFFEIRDGLRRKAM